MGGNGENMEEWNSLISSPKNDLFQNFKTNSVLNDGSIDSTNDKNEEVEVEKLRVCSLAERRAAKFGFNAARFRTLGSPGSGARSPCLTIPPGISPTALLDSPIMLPNSQPSPTTGTLPFPPLGHGSLVMDSGAPSVDVDWECNSSFSFRPPGSPITLPFSGSEIQGSSPCDFSQSSGADVDYQNLAPGRLDFEFAPELLQEIASSKFSSADVNVSSAVNVNATCRALQTSESNGQTPPRRHCTDGEDGGTDNLQEEEEKAAYPQRGIVKTSEDGYNWRKYGQKQVKGSEFPRSYYKCTHPSCQVKKKVERSHDGQITEIIYKGSHNHPKPQHNRRSALGSAYSFNELPEMDEGSDTHARIEGVSIWRNIQTGSRDTKIGSEWRHDGVERTSSTSVVTELSDPASTFGKATNIFESAGMLELSSTLASNDDDDEDQVTQGSLSIGDDAEDDESDPKRRKTEACLVETNMGSRGVREPKVVVQIESDVDILDDGYRWRKYGQKVVKGNPNPRSYYKCTSAGCSVRKHVERASQNLKCVITTYEGKHNHEVPASRNSSHMNSSSGNVPPTAQSTHLMLRYTNMPKTETQVQDLMPHFERKPNLGNGFLRSNILGNYGHDMKFGPPSIYQMKFPPLQTMPYGSFALNRSHSGVPQPGLGAPMVQDLAIPMPLSLPRSGDSMLAGFDFSNQGSAISQVQPFHETDMRFVKPKKEEKDEDIYDASDQAKASLSSSSLYHQMMGRFA